jgi:hypothetical protein
MNMEQEFEAWLLSYSKPKSLIVAPSVVNRYKAAFKAGMEVQRKADDNYRKAVDDALVCWEMVATGNARTDLNDLICQELAVALDPAVSLDARVLIRLGASEQRKRDVEIARRWRGSDGVSCSCRLDIAAAIERNETERGE